jgi:hypothetical protein
LRLSSDFPVSKFAFEFNLYRYTAGDWFCQLCVSGGVCAAGGGRAARAAVGRVEVELC